jgi:multiple sugar transport system permease protein
MAEVMRSDAHATSGRPRLTTRLAHLPRQIGRRPGLLASVLIAPAVVLRLATGMWPFAATVWTSLHRSGPTVPEDEWVGVANYVALGARPAVQEAAFYTGFYTILSTVLELLIGLGIALLLQATFRGRNLARAVTLVPWAIPVVVSGIAFRVALDGDFGVLADAIMRFTPYDGQVLLERWPARLAVVGGNVWRNSPFVAVILLAALQSIPRDMHEASKVDGASAWQHFRYITLPIITPVMISIGTFFLIWQIALFDQVLSMTGGGPGNATQVLGYLAYLEGFASLNFGRAAALSLMLTAFVAFLGLIGAALLRRAESRL